MLSYISLGNLTLADELIARSEQDNISVPVGSLSTHNPFLQAQYSLVASITLFCRAAIDGGLPETLAYNISDCYIQYLERIRTMEEVSILFINAFREYCQVLQEWRLQRSSAPLRVCCEYIMSHLHERIALSDLSDACHLSPNYVSELFNRELGIRPSAFIREEKLKYASVLLKSTNLSVAQISAQIAMPSPSAFAEQFGKQFGNTPSQYRIKFQK